MMNSISVNAQSVPVGRTKGELAKTHAKVRVWTAALLVSASSAFLAGLGGILMSSFVQSGAVAAVLCVACLILLFYSAHCMDRLGSSRKQIKLVEYKEKESLRRDDHGLGAGEF